jgi:hypothetical protein
MWDNREYSIKIEDNVMQEYEKIMLTSGICELFMPMGFMIADKGEMIHYDCSGFAPLSRFQIDKTDDALYILENILLILNKATEYLITPSKIMLNTDTVFYNKETGEVKIAYVPLREKDADLKKNLVNFIGQLKIEIQDKYVKYLLDTAKCVYHYNYQINDIINKIGLFRREIYYMEKNKVSE